MKVFSDIPYNARGQVLDVDLPDVGPVKAVFVYFHGGGLENGDKNSRSLFIHHLTHHQIAVVDVRYRMYPRAKYPEFIEDAADAVAWTFQNIGQYTDCRKIFAGGSSAGGYLSMMLCFDKQYLGRHGLKPTDLAGFIHDAGQPTVHFNVLRERGIDTRRLIVDEAAPLYHIGADGTDCPDMLFLVSDGDMENRYEQTMLVLSTLKHFRYDPMKIQCQVLHGSHCHYVNRADATGQSIFGQLIEEFVDKVL